MSETAEFPCGLCQGEQEHTDGCPSAGPTIVLCGVCGEDLPLAGLAAHLEEHGVDAPSQDELEESLGEVRAQLKGRLEQAVSAAEIIPLSLDSIWNAVGYKTVTGVWPPGFVADDAVLVTLAHLDEAKRRVIAHHKVSPDDPTFGHACVLCEQVVRGEDR